jgi:starch synthase
MHIVFAASECVPFSKTGGLADVVGALPRALVAAGHQVSVYLPRYRHTLLKHAGTLVKSVRCLSMTGTGFVLSSAAESAPE